MSRLEDLNSYLYILQKNNKLETFKILEDIEPLIDAFLKIEIQPFIPNEKTYFTTEEAIELVYKFLKENYPDKAYLYGNVIDRDNNIMITTKEERKYINKLIYQRLIYYLRHYDLDTSVKLLQQELEKITNPNIQNALDIIIAIQQKINKEKPFSKFQLKHKANQALKLSASQETISGVRFKYNKIETNDTTEDNSIIIEDYSIIEIVNSNDIYTIITILHEYIHKDNIIVVKNDFSSTKKNYSTTSIYLGELPSIALEMQLIEWLYQNKYITNIDYKYVIYLRLNSSFNSALTLKAIKLVLDIFKKNKVVNDKLIEKELEKINNQTIRNKLLEKIYYMDNIFYNVISNIGNSEINKITTYFSYVLSTILSITILKRTKDNSEYRTNLIKVNDNLIFLDYPDALNILNLDYSNQDIMNEIINNLLEYYKNYNKIELQDKSTRRKR